MPRQNHTQTKMIVRELPDPRTGIAQALAEAGATGGIDTNIRVLNAAPVNAVSIKPYEDQPEFTKVSFFDDDKDDPPVVPPKKSLFHNYKDLKKLIDKFSDEKVSKSLYDDSVEYDKCYYIVAKPYNKDYEQYKNWFTSKEAFEHVRKQFKLKNYFLTLERNSAKPHLNILMFTNDTSPMQKHDTATNYYKYHVEEIESVNHLSNVCEYIIKESKDRVMKEGIDYIIR